MNIKTKSTKYIIASLGLLSLAGISFVSNPPASANTSSSANVTFTANIAEILSLTCTQPSALTLTNGGTVQSSSHTCTTTTNSASGYAITADTTTATAPADATSNLRTAAGDIIAYGTPAQNSSAWNLTVTAGGSETVTSPVPFGTGAGQSLTQAPVASYGSPTAGLATTITFNASASGSQAAGTYQDVVTYTIAANDPPASGS